MFTKPLCSWERERERRERERERREVREEIGVLLSAWQLPKGKEREQEYHNFVGG